MEEKRDHLFISYASEQAALCDWLARRLAIEGYAVWYDRLKLLGGEDWPKDIDRAIEKRTFRMLALMSRAYTQKPNPRGEWLKGSAFGRNELKIEDFVIPLNTEGLRPQEIPWNFQTTNYIAFSPSWSNGLTDLLSKLESVKAPRALSEGHRLAARSIIPAPVVLDSTEQLISNCFPIEQIPRQIKTFAANSDLSDEDFRELRTKWAFHDVSPTRCLAFHGCPGELARRFGLRYVGQHSWRTATRIEGVQTRHILVTLIRRSLELIFVSHGMKYDPSAKMWYLPDRKSDKWITCTLVNGKTSRFLRVGTRSYWSSRGSEKYRYHLSPSLSILGKLDDSPILALRIRIYLTDMTGNPLEHGKALSRRKHLTKSWFNREWSVRTLGLIQSLGANERFITLGPEGDQQLIIDTMPVSPYAPKSIHDDNAEEPDGIYTMWHEDDESFDG